MNSWINQSQIQSYGFCLVDAQKIEPFYISRTDDFVSLTELNQFRVEALSISLLFRGIICQIDELFDNIDRQTLKFENFPKKSVRFLQLNELWHLLLVYNFPHENVIHNNAFVNHFVLVTEVQIFFWNQNELRLVKINTSWRKVRFPGRYVEFSFLNQPADLVSASLERLRKYLVEVVVFDLFGFYRLHFWFTYKLIFKKLHFEYFYFNLITFWVQLEVV